MTDSTISGNETGVDGGGIFDSGMLTVTDTTISGNIAAISVPVIAIGNGGGIYDKPPSSKSISVTLTNEHDYRQWHRHLRRQHRPAAIAPTAAPRSR